MNPLKTLITASMLDDAAKRAATRNTQKQRRIETLKSNRQLQNRVRMKNSMIVDLRPVGGVFITPKKKEKLCVFVPDQLGMKITEAQLMTPEALQETIKNAPEWLERGHMTQEKLEKVLDLLFVELEKKLAKRA